MDHIFIIEDYTELGSLLERNLKLEGYRVTPVEDEFHRNYAGPVSFELSPAQPNPFNSAVRIGYEIPYTAPVTLTVYDVAGREVARLADGSHPAGCHSIVWDATGRSAGVYLFVLSWQDGRTTQRTVLLK